MLSPAGRTSVNDTAVRPTVVFAFVIVNASVEVLFSGTFCRADKAVPDPDAERPAAGFVYVNEEPVGILVIVNVPL